MKHFFLSLCIIVFKKKDVKKTKLQKNKDKNKKNDINKPRIVINI